MTKPVPDPPLTTQTATTFGSCNGSHGPLFAVPAGVSSEDALIHASIRIKSAYQTNAQACGLVAPQVRNLLWGSQHTLEMSLALIETLLDEVEARAATSTVLQRSVEAFQAAVK
ncbi:DUF3077 domain-containing protein [Pseudomonas vranovensis]|uniref:DUF3077 domain-containing protein n=1 Tax=Pseudomonas vranovensis TaxID=321661 RepID=UPI0003FE224B|nr:DUF3077 domain-containing protein [Pseudomonas vranovensis]